MSLPFTVDNHFVFGYNDIPFAEKMSPVDSFFCKYSKCNREPQSFKQECIHTAMEVSSQAYSFNRIPYIFLSGGLDSEVVVRAFMDANVPFNTISFRFTNNVSAHETYYIDKFVKKHDLTHTYFDIDPDWVTSQEAISFLEQARCNMGQMLPHMKLMKYVWEELNGFPVLGNGDLYVSKNISPQWIFDRSKPKYEWKYIEFEYILAWNRFAVKNKILGSLGFFMHNPEIVLAMIREPDMNKCLHDLVPYKLSSRSTKAVVYIKSWPDLEPRPKYNGSEKMGGRYVSLNLEYSNKFKTSGTWEVPIAEFISNLEPIK